MKLNKKGQSVLDNFGSLAIGVGTFAIVIIVAFLIMGQAKTNMTNDNSKCAAGGYWNASSAQCCVKDSAICTGTNISATSDAWNATRTLQTATDGIPGWVSIIIITAIGAALIGMVAMFRR